MVSVELPRRINEPANAPARVTAAPIRNANVEAGHKRGVRSADDRGDLVGTFGRGNETLTDEVVAVHDLGRGATGDAADSQLGGQDGGDPRHDDRSEHR